MMEWMRVTDRERREKQQWDRWEEINVHFLSLFLCFTLCVCPSLSRSLSLTDVWTEPLTWFQVFLLQDRQPFCSCTEYSDSAERQSERLKKVTKKKLKRKCENSVKRRDSESLHYDTIQSLHCDKIQSQVNRTWFRSIAIWFRGDSEPFQCNTTKSCFSMTQSTTASV